MLSLRRIVFHSSSGGGGSIARCISATTKRGNSTLVAAAVDNNTSQQTSYNNTSHQQQQQRYFSTNKYAKVDHSTAYEQAMSSSHGTQLKLALEEGRGKDDGPFDPFTQFLNEMGTTLDEDENLEVGEGEENDDIEEAEYKTIEEEEEEGEYEEDDDMDDMDELDDDEDTDGPIYTNTGALYRPKSERLALRAGYPAGGKFAVIELAGFQHKVTVDDLLVVNKLKPVSEWSVGSTHTIKDEDILLMADQDKTLVGLPGVKGAEVDVMVEEITRDKTLIIFKKRRRKNSRRKNGFRRQVTFLRVMDVRMPSGEEESKGTNNKGINDVVIDDDMRVAA